LRHGGYLVLVEELLLYQKYYITVTIISRTMCYIKAYGKILVICAGPLFNFTPKKAFLLSVLSWERAVFLFAFRNFYVAEICRFASMKEIFVTPKISTCGCVRE